MSAEAPSPLEQALRTAETNINDLLGDDSTRWSLHERHVAGREEEWVVGDNTGVADGREVRIGQSLGPNAKGGEVFYRASTPGGDIYWQHGAKSLGDLRYGPERHDSAYTNSGLALRALHSVGSARLREPGGPDHKAAA